MKCPLVLTPQFARAFRKITRRHTELQQRIEESLQRMEEDVFAPTLDTHKLSGTLAGLRACTCGYDCRIVFSLERSPNSDTEVIVLLNIGTHDEVY